MATKTAGVTVQSVVALGLDLGKDDIGKAEARQEDEQEEKLHACVFCNLVERDNVNIEVTRPL